MCSHSRSVAIEFIVAGAFEFGPALVREALLEIAT